jgi:hypothetical protein
LLMNFFLIDRDRAGNSNHACILRRVGFSGKRWFSLGIQCAAQHRYFGERIKIITGIESGDILREKFAQGCERLQANRWEMTSWGNVSFSELMNLKSLYAMT